MKKALLSLVVGTLIVTGCSRGSKVYPYPFNSAKITFKLDGELQGTAVLSIKGDKTAKEVHALNTRTNTQENTLYIDKDGTIYKIDLDQKTGVTANNPIYQDLKNTPANQKEDYLKNKALGLTGSQQISDNGQKTVAGQTCSLYSSQGQDVCLWDDVVIYSNFNVPEIGYSSTMEATQIEKDTNIPDSTFDIPADVQLQAISTQQTQR